MKKFGIASSATVKSGKLAVIGAVLAAVVCLAGTARADTLIYGSVWENSTSYPNALSKTPPAGTPNVTFTVSSPSGEDFSFYSSTDDSLNSFLTYGHDTVNYLTGASNKGASINDDTMQFTGMTYLTAHTTYTITHDDGMYLWLTGNGLSNTLEINSGSPTAADGSTFSVGTSGYYDFDLLYAEVNGPPAELQSSDFIAATPEPSSLLFMGTGLLGLAFVVFWKNKPSGLVLHS
jgi:hypothetical protein